MKTGLRVAVAALLCVASGSASATVTGTSLTSGPYTCNGSQTAFTASFRFLDASDLVVTKKNSSTNQETALSIGTDYSVSGTGGTSGTVTLTSGSKCGSGYTLTVRRTVSLTQPTSFKTQGSFSPATHENAFDRVTMGLQQVNEAVVSGAATQSYVQSYVSTATGSGEATQASSWAFTGDGSTTIFNVSGASSSVAALYFVAINGSVKTPTVDYTVDGTTQRITFAAAPANASTVSVRLFAFQPYTYTPTVAHRFTFPTNGAPLSDDANTKCHLSWTTNDALTDSKGCAWAATGAPAAVSASDLYPTGWTSTARHGRGPLDDTNYYSLGTGNDVMDLATGTVCVVFSIPAANTDATNDVLYSNEAYKIYIKGGVGVRQVCADWTSGSNCGPNVPLSTPFLACMGHDGAGYGYASFGSPAWSTKASTTPNLTHATIAYVGRNAAAGQGSSAKIWELWVTSTVPSAVDIQTIWKNFSGEKGTSNESLVVYRTTEDAVSVNGTSYTMPTHQLRTNESGVLLNTDWVRSGRGYGLGTSRGGMSFGYKPTFAFSAAGDKVLLSDWPWGGNALTSAKVELRYVDAGDLFRLTVNNATVDSAAQTFSANSANTISWRYYTDGKACLTVNGAETCSSLSVSPFTPGAFVSLGGNLMNTYSNGTWSDIAFDVPVGDVATAVAALGDSTTEGHFNCVGCITYPERLGASLGGTYTVDNFGVVGNLIAQVRDRWRQYIKGRGYRYVILVGGINDLLGSATGATTYATWEELAEEVRTSSGTTLIVSTTFPVDGSATWNATRQGYLDTLNTSINAYCAAHTDVRCIDGYTLLEDPGNADHLLAAYDSGDHTHLTAAGNTAVANAFRALFP